MNPYSQTDQKSIRQEFYSAEQELESIEKKMKILLKNQSLDFISLDFKNGLIKNLKIFLMNLSGDEFEMLVERNHSKLKKINELIRLIDK